MFQILNKMNVSLPYNPSNDWQKKNNNETENKGTNLSHNQHVPGFAYESVTSHLGI